jgi:hypothetical protein
MTVACRQQGSESFIPANNSNISYSGRFDFSHKSKPVFMYSGCAIRTVFNGTSVALIMKDDSLRNLFTVKIIRWKSAGERNGMPGILYSKVSASTGGRDFPNRNQGDMLLSLSEIHTPADMAMKEKAVKNISPMKRRITI